MPDVSIINVNNTDYSIKDATARTAAQAAQSTAEAAQSTAEAAQSYAESINLKITYNLETETVIFTKGD